MQMRSIALTSLIVQFQLLGPPTNVSTEVGPIEIYLILQLSFCGWLRQCAGRAGNRPLFLFTKLLTDMTRGLDGPGI